MSIKKVHVVEDELHVELHFSFQSEKFRRYLFFFLPQRSLSASSAARATSASLSRSLSNTRARTYTHTHTQLHEDASAVRKRSACHTTGYDFLRQRYTSWKRKAFRKYKQILHFPSVVSDCLWYSPIFFFGGGCRLFFVVVAADERKLEKSPTAVSRAL